MGSNNFGRLEHRAIERNAALGACVVVDEVLENALHAEDVAARAGADAVLGHSAVNAANDVVRGGFEEEMSVVATALVEDGGGIHDHFFFYFVTGENVVDS